MAPGFKWTVAEEKTLLLALSRHLLGPSKKLNAADYQAVLNAWPANPTTKGLSGTPTFRGIQDRIRDLRHFASDLLSDDSSSAAPANAAVQVPHTPAAHRVTVRPSKLKLEKQNDQASDPGADGTAATNDGASADNMTAATLQNPHKARVGKRTTKSGSLIKGDPDFHANISTPASRKTTTAAASLPTPATSTRAGASNKRKRSATVSKLSWDDSNTDSSEEAVLTDDCDDDDNTAPDSPTPTAKKQRTAYTRLTKAHAQGALSYFDGPDRGDESDSVGLASDNGAGKQWADVMKKQAIKKRVRVTRDDSGEDWEESD